MEIAHILSALSTGKCVINVESICLAMYSDTTAGRPTATVSILFTFNEFNCIFGAFHVTIHLEAKDIDIRDNKTVDLIESGI